MTIPPNRITAFPLKDDLQWYDPEVVFLPQDDIFGRGVIGSTDLQVIANGGGDGQISVQSGRGYVPYAGGGKRLFKTSVSIRSDAAEFLTAIPTWGGGNPRIHRIIARIKDATINTGDVIKGGVFDVLPGVATSGANLTNLSGAQAVPADSLLLGNVFQNGATIPTGNIDSTFGTVRARARVGAGNSPGHTFEVGGAALTDRQALNLIAGTGITITAVDNSGADSADVTITSSLTVPAAVCVVLADSGVLAVDTATIDWTAISGTYTNLVLEWYARTNAAVSFTDVKMRFNNDSGNNYANDLWYIDQSGVVSGAATAGSDNFAEVGYVIGTSSAGQQTGHGSVRIPGYSSTALNKSTLVQCLVYSGSTALRWVYGGSRWGSTAAINRITLFPAVGSFLAGSRFVLYGFA